MNWTAGRRPESGKKECNEYCATSTIHRDILHEEPPPDDATENSTTGRQMRRLRMMGHLVRNLLASVAPHTHSGNPPNHTISARGYDRRGLCETYFSRMRCDMNQIHLPQHPLLLPLPLRPAISTTQRARDNGRPPVQRDTNSGMAENALHA